MAPTKENPQREGELPGAEKRENGDTENKH